MPSNKPSNKKNPLPPSGGAGPRKLTGAEIIWECLERLGVEHVFGYPGGAILPDV